MVAGKGHLIVVSGPSGVGKTTLIERFLKEDQNSRFSVSYTTRKKRASEIDGKDYYFTDSETFRRMIEQGRFLEWESVHGYLYGTPKQEASAGLTQGIDVILDIDVKGAIKVKEACTRASLIFVEPPSIDELVRRLALRGEPEIEKRMERVKEEMAQKHLFTYSVRNDTLDDAYLAFKSVVAIIRGQGHGQDNC